MSTLILKPTPLKEYPELAQAVGVEKLFIKREDLNPSGSHKDRSIWSMIEHYLKIGKEHFVISSSGNAAISAAYYAAADLRGLNADSRGHIKLHIFISPNIAQDKRQRLDQIVSQGNNITIHESNRAKSDAIKYAKDNNYQLIRTSTDDTALEGYEKLAKEIKEQTYRGFARKCDKTFDIFIPTSSGTTLQGIFNKFKNYLSLIRTNKGTIPKLHAVQTSKVSVMAREFDQDFKSTEASLASAIVDTIGHRKEAVIKVINDSGGSGWVISDEALQEVGGLVEKHTEIEGSSWDSLLSLAGLIKAKKQGLDIKNAILLFTGV